MAEETKKDPDQVEPQTTELAQSDAPGQNQPSQTQQSAQGQPQQLESNPGVQKNKHLFAKITCCLFFVFLIFIGAVIFYIQLSMKDEQKPANNDRKNQKATYNIPDTSKFTNKKNYSVAAVFIHRGEETPDEVIDTVCDPDQTKTNSYYHTGYWFRAQAANYGVDFNMQFKCLKKKIKPPSYFDADPNSFITCSDGSKIKSGFSHFLEFDPWLRKTYPELAGYDYIAMTLYDSTNEYRCPSHGPAYANTYQNTAMMELKRQFSAEEAKSLMGQNTNQAFYNPDIYAGRLPVYFAHEFAHIIGKASDKYEVDEKGISTGNCRVDKVSGIRYEDGDVMCHGDRTLQNTKITIPTAKELGWM